MLFHVPQFIVLIVLLPNALPAGDDPPSLPPFPSPPSPGIRAWFNGKALADHELPAKNDPPKSPPAKVHVWVNGKPLFDDDITLYYPPLTALYKQFAGLSPDDPKVKEFITSMRNQVIDQELLYQAAVNKLEKRNGKLLEKLKKEAEKKYDEAIHSYRENFKKKYFTINPQNDDVQFRKDEARFIETLRDQSWLMRRKTERDFIAGEYLKSRVLGKSQPDSRFRD